MKVKVGYGQGVTVVSPANRFENAKFNLNLGFEFEWDEIPTDDEASDVWRSALKARIQEEVGILRAQVEDELQTDVDQFKTDNSGAE